MSLMRRVWNRLQHDRGQAIIFFAASFTIIAIGGAIAVDFGLWVGERRGAQTDADLSALSGAWELLDSSASAGDASAAALGTLTDNDESGNASLAQPIVVDDSCFNQGTLDAVIVDVNHDSRSLFAGMFGMGEPSIGAHAKACKGAADGLTGLVPIQIDNDGPCFDVSETPIFTELCPLEFGASDTNPRGIIDLEAPGDYCSHAPGAGEIEEFIENGAPGHCVVNESGNCDPQNNGPWYDCVAVQGGNPKKVIEGFANRIANEGSCDDDNSGVEEFDETVVTIIDTGDPTTSVYEARECPDGHISWRIVSIIVLEENPPTNSGNSGYAIDAFAAFYVRGCYAGDEPPGDPPVLDFECTELGPGSPPGHVVVFGNFVNLVVPGTGIGVPNDSTTIFGIALVE